MDSNQEANLANIKTARLTKWLVVLAVMQIVSPFLYLWLSQRSDPSHVPPTGQGGGFVMTGWTPIILLFSSSVVTATALLIVASKRWKNKRLAGEIAQLQADLAKEKESARTIDGLESGNQELRRQNTKLTIDLADANSEKERPDQKRLQLIAKQDREEIQDSVIVSAFNSETRLTTASVMSILFSLFSINLSMRSRLITY